MKWICGVVGMFAVTLVALNARAEDAKEDLKAVQGTWELVYFERDGKEVKVQSDTKAINSGDMFVVKVGDKVVAAGVFKFDPSKKPKASETTYTEGMDKGKTFKGIYQLDGDMLKLCRAGSPDQERPTEFKSKPDSGQFVAVYRRAK